MGLQANLEQVHGNWLLHVTLYSCLAYKVCQGI